MDTTPTPTANDGFMKRMLDVVEKAGNKVPHPAMIFLFLMVVVIVLSHILKSASVPPLVLLLGFIVVVAIIDLLITGAIAKWALFAPIFVPLLFVVWFLLGLPWGL